MDFFAKFGERESAGQRRANAQFLLGLGHLGLGHAPEARAAFDEALRAGRQPHVGERNASGDALSVKLARVVIVNSQLPTPKDDERVTVRSATAAPSPGCQAARAASIANPRLEQWAQPLP